jgi:hypothetical protein
MPTLNHKGPEGEGSGTGRGLGNCIDRLSNDEKLIKLGKGMGRRRKSGGGQGFEKRLKSGLK